MIRIYDLLKEFIDMNSAKRFFVVMVGLIHLIGTVHLIADTHLSNINDDQILHKRDSIVQRIQRNHYEKLALYSIMASVVIGSGMYYMLPQGDPDLVTLPRKQLEGMSLAFAKALSEKSQDVVPAVPKSVVPQVDSNIFVSTFHGLKNTCGTIFGPVKDFVVYSAKLGWQGAVSSFLLHHMLAATRIPDKYLKPFKILGSQLERRAAHVYEHLFFKPTLQWYIANHTHLKINFKRLYTCAYVIEHHKLPEIVQSINQDDVVDLCESFEKSELQLSDEQIQLYYDKFKMVWSLCVHDIEGIMGFLEFKKTTIADHADEYDYALRAIRLMVENFVVMFESRYSVIWKTEQACIELSQEVKKFTHLLQVECDNCIITEYAYA